MCWQRNVRNLLCTALLVCATSRADSPVRIGWIDDFSVVGITADQVDTLNARTQSFQTCGHHEDSIVLVDCPADRVSVEGRTVEGACGQTLKLPIACDLSVQARMLRGVWMSAVRPHHDQRQDWLTRQRRTAKNAAADRWPRLDADDVPSDVIVSINRTGDWFIGCDFDLDLQFQLDEQFLIPTDKVGTAQIVQCGRDVLLLQTQLTDNVPSLSMVCVSGSAPGQWAASWRPAVVDIALEKLPHATRWQLFSADNGPAEMVVAMEAAARAQCDLVVINLHGRKRHPTDAARLLAELSRSLRLPAVVNVPTPLSPNYVIEPARLSVPDIAEFRLQHVRPSPQAFRKAVVEAIEQHAARALATQAVPLTGLLTKPSYYASPVAGKLSTTRFARLSSLAEDTSDTSSEMYAVRVPADAMDGRVVFPHVQDSFDSLNVTLYDRDGRRITGLEHSNGVRFDHFPPVLAAHARGGTLLSPSQLFCRGKTLDVESEGVTVRWRRGKQPTTQLIGQPYGASQTLTVTGHGESPETLQITPVHRVSGLQNVPPALVPEPVRQAAKDLLNRSSHVATFWYREAPRDGDYTLRHLFQTSESERVWPNRLLQYAVIYENGRISSDDHAIGDLATSTPLTGWILLQAAIPAAAHPAHTNVSNLARATAPELLQRWPAAQTAGPNANQWSRTQLTKQDDETDHTLWTAKYVGSTVGYDVLASDRTGDGESIWARIGDGDLLSPMLGMLQVKIPHSTQLDTGWLPLYDHDPLLEVIKIRKQQGQTPKEILQATDEPADDSTDILAWRQYLLAVDQPELRKQHLDRVVRTAQQVLMLCKQQLAGLPAAKAPYDDESLAASGAPAGQPDTAPAVFQRPSSPAQQQVYAWAVDAVYRQVRAIGYRELPEVITLHPIEDWETQNEAYESTFYQLCGMVDIKDPRFVLTLVRYHRRRNEPRQAYEALKWHAYSGPSLPWYFKKERDLFRDSGSEPLARLGSARWFLREAGQAVPDRQP